MSGLKHAVKRRVHLERSSPSGPKGSRPLERKKETKVRLKKEKGKKKLLGRVYGICLCVYVCILVLNQLCFAAIMTHKSRDRNPDEFRFGMKSSKMINGKFLKLTSE